MRLAKALLLTLLSVIHFAAFSQVTSIEVEVYQEHTGDLPLLTGFTTYRLHAVCANQTDFVSSVYGVAGTPLQINTTTFFYQNAFGGVNGTSINTAFFAFFPELEFDSWITIGRSSSLDPGAQVSAVQSSSDLWIDQFEAGQDIIIDGDFGGSWFTINGANSVNGFAGPDNKVLLGQFTTEGILSGYLNVQLFLNGDNNNSQLYTQLPFSSNTSAIFGCTDPNATNFNPDATDDDGSCSFPCTLSLDNILSTSPSCFGGNNGNLTFITSGGQGAVTYQLDGGNVFLSNSFSGLTAGPHTIIITDGQGCTVSQTVVLAPSPQLVLAIQNKLNVSCNGAGDRKSVV